MIAAAIQPEEGFGTDRMRCDAKGGGGVKSRAWSADLSQPHGCDSGEVAAAKTRATESRQAGGIGLLYLCRQSLLTPSLGNRLGH
jgi:hypothetical protein